MAVKGIGVIILFLILILAGSVTSGILIVRNPCKGPKEIPEVPLRPGKPVGRQARIYEMVHEKGGDTQYIGPEFTVASSFCPAPHGTTQCNPNAGPGTNTTCQCCPGPVPCPGSQDCEATCGGVSPSCPNCLNGGTCVSGKCVCLPNFGGPSCASGKCSNGNLCNPDLGPPHCQCCPDGSPCPGSPSECATTPGSKGGCGPESGGKTCPPCINGGTCNTKTGVCDCLPGWGDPICSSGLCPDGKTLCNPAGSPNCQCCPGGGPCPHSPDSCKTTCVAKCTPNCPVGYCGPDLNKCGVTCKCDSPYLCDIHGGCCMPACTDKQGNRLCNVSTQCDTDPPTMCQCGSGETCVNGKCTTGPCKPDCTANYCGPSQNSCAGNCVCGTGQTCQNNKCVTAPCTPDCPPNYCGKETKCGTICPYKCPPGTTCSGDHKCVKTVCQPDCPVGYCGKETRCGTICSCPSGTTCQNNKCVSVMPPQPTRLQVESKCKDPIWIALGQDLCDLNRNANNTKLTKGGSPLNLKIPEGGVGSLGLHAKRDCLVNGNACVSGEWTGQLPPGKCIGDKDAKGRALAPICTWADYPDRHCQPPYSTYFEATYEPTTGTDNLTNFDTSAVNGYDIPIGVTASNAGQGKCKDVSCSLDLSGCPQSEDLTKYREPGSSLPTVVKGQDLTSVDLRVWDKYTGNKPAEGATVVGCMSPCQKLTGGYPWGLELSPSNPVVKWYCCTHNPDCGNNDALCQTPVTKDYVCQTETDLWGMVCDPKTPAPCGIATWKCTNTNSPDGQPRCYRASRGNCQAPPDQTCDVGWTAVGLPKSRCSPGYNCSNGVCVTGVPGCNGGKCPTNSSCNSAGWCEQVDSPKCCSDGYDCDSTGICKEVQIVNPQCNAKTRPVINTDYVKWVKASCPDTYAWQYDDHVSDIDCPDNTSFKVTYCPDE